MAASKPCIVSNIKANTDIVINNYNGIVLDTLNSIDLSEKIMDLLNNKTLMNEIGNNAFKTVQKDFSRNRMIKSYCDLILDWN